MLHKVIIWDCAPKNESIMIPLVIPLYVLFGKHENTEFLGAYPNVDLCLNFFDLQWPLMVWGQNDMTYDAQGYNTGMHVNIRFLNTFLKVDLDLPIFDH